MASIWDNIKELAGVAVNSAVQGATNSITKADELAEEVAHLKASGTATPEQNAAAKTIKGTEVAVSPVVTIGGIGVSTGALVGISVAVVGVIVLIVALFRRRR